MPSCGHAFPARQSDNLRHTRELFQCYYWSHARYPLHRGLCCDCAERRLRAARDDCGSRRPAREWTPHRQRCGFRAARRLAGEDGAFVLRDLPPGAVRLRFRRVGFAPKDTALVVGANDTAQVRIEMTRLALALPTVVVDGTCMNRTPFEQKPAVLAALFDQVTQNAERLRLLARERPFAMELTNTRGIERRGPLSSDTVVRGPLPSEPYAPRRILRRQGRIRSVALRRRWSFSGAACSACDGCPPRRRRHATAWDGRSPDAASHRL